MKNLRLCSVLAFVLLFAFEIQAKVEAVIGSVPLQQNENLPNFMPAASDSEILISRDQYVISYNRKRRAPNWVAWKLEASDLGSVKRSNSFEKDPDLEKYFEQTGSRETGVEPSDYTGTCFDRGHQVPSGDRTDTDLNNRETFLMSNMIPQTAYLNRVIWEHLEAYTRDLALSGKKLYVVAGPIYDEDFGKIGSHHDIPVPSKDFKIIFVLDANQDARDIGPQTQTIAVIMPNVLQDGTKPSNGSACSDKSGAEAAALNFSTLSRNDWQKYRSTAAEIQKLSGVHFVLNH